MTKSSFQLKNKDFVYPKTKWIKLSRNTIIYFYEVTMILVKYYSFYDK